MILNGFIVPHKKSLIYVDILYVEVFMLCPRSPFLIRAWHTVHGHESASLTSRWLASQKEIPSAIAADMRFGGHRAERVGETSHPGSGS